MANVLQHFSESEHKRWKQRLAELFACEDYNEATSMADQIDADLRKGNVSVTQSFTEGLIEVLTLCRLGLTRSFKKSFGSTSIVESANAAIARRTCQISRWSTGNQRLRCVHSPLLSSTSTGTNWLITHDCLCCRVP